MLDIGTYQFGYSWPITYGHLVPLTVAVVLGVVAMWRRWPRVVLGLAGLVALWSIGGLVISYPLTVPMDLPTTRFLSSGSGRVLDAGAGSGRAAIGVLLARPSATAVGMDIYEGYWGIEGNTPERFMLNARIAGVADRADARRGDLREMPFGEGEFDAVISAYAIDHLGSGGIVKALAEVARVLKPRGEFLLMIVNADRLTRVLSPHAIGHHPRQDPARWRARLDEAGFALEEEGTKPATLYFLARKRL